MVQCNWLEEALKRKEACIQDAQKLLRIKSVLNEEEATADAPLGHGVKDALKFMLALGERDGFLSKNVGNLAGHLEFGEGEECVGILCHVDVVPEGDGWSTDPFGAEIKDGKLFGRGAIDDKGPTMAAYYAMKIVKDSGLPMSKRVRMIIGTDEESDWRCVEHYFKHEEMPSVGFAPDADFPIIFAEKGIADMDVVQSQQVENQNTDSRCEVISFEAGRRYNMVPDKARVILLVKRDKTDLIQRFTEFLSKHDVKGSYHVDNGGLVLEVEGISAHGMEPNHGKNAGLYLAQFLSERDIDQRALTYFSFVASYFFQDSRGKKLSIAYSDDISGELTINVGKLSYMKETGGVLGLNIRYPVTNDMEMTKTKLDKLVAEKGFHIDHFTDSKPHHVDENSELISVLKKVYEEQTGEKADLLAIGGGTYARSLKKGVAFGPLFPGREDIAHQKDEYMYIEDLVKATAIYAQAIYELAK